MYSCVLALARAVGAAIRANLLFQMVARDGIEPPARGFSAGPDTDQSEPLKTQTARGTMASADPEQPFASRIEFVMEPKIR